VNWLTEDLIYLVGRILYGQQKFESVDDLHHHSKEISALEYSTFAKTWIDMGSKVIGGCCGTTPEHIRMILENSLSRSDIS